MSSPPLRIAVLVSGGGSTFSNINQRRLSGTLDIEIPLVLASRACQGVALASEAGINCPIVDRKTFASTSQFSHEIFTRCRDAGVGLIALGGFLSQLQVPDDFENRVMNIHPSLIPAFCGPGMYGHHVHEAVLARGCKVTGCTVHFVDNEYDHGPIIVQRSVAVLDTDTPETLAARVFTAESEAYPEAIRLFGSGRLRVLPDGTRTSVTPQ